LHVAPSETNSLVPVANRAEHLLKRYINSSGIKCWI